ncbi:hypothetical protein [Rhodococcus sp. X156]|nr:hypothetical protein [Rhodococcus sp. X156]
MPLPPGAEPLVPAGRPSSAVVPSRQGSTVTIVDVDRAQEASQR